MPDLSENKKLGDQTVIDFGDQWQRYTDNEGYYGSIDILADTFGPLLHLSDLKEQRVGEIGSGTGRIVSMLLNAGAGHVIAVEPSIAFDVLKRNTAGFSDRVSLLRLRGDEIPADLNLDLIVSIGVIHHIPDPAPVMRAAYHALRPGGRCLVWLYGHEGNEAVVRGIQCIRALTTKMPHWAIAALAQFFTTALDIYAAIIRLIPGRMPLKSYIQNIIGKFSRRKRYLVIYDQLRPAYAKYYRKDEACALLENAGFVDIKSYHRQQYSWTITGTRPS